MTKIESLAAWFQEFANTLVGRKLYTDGLTGKGILNVYIDNRSRMPRYQNCIRLDVLVSHLSLPENGSCTRREVMAAIGSLIPAKGSGGSGYVRIVTPERVQAEVIRAENKLKSNEFIQNETRNAFLREAGIMAYEQNLPTHNYVATDTVQ